MNYLPYESLIVSWLPEFAGLQLSLPWLQMNVEVDDDEREWLKVGIRNLHSHSLNPNTQKFLSFFKEYPIAYTQPRTISEFKKILSKKNMPTDIDLSSPIALMNSLNIKTCPEILTEIISTWSWDLTDILNKTRIPQSNSYDPMSLVTYLICKRLEVESYTDALRKDFPRKLNHLRQTDEAQFFEVMKKFLRHTHFVTSQLQGCCYPALQTFSQAQDIIQNFMNEELGHDILMAESLQILGCTNPQDVAVFPSLITLMQLYKSMASLSPLAFTLMTGYFEGVSYTENDDLAVVLQRSSRPETAKGYTIHHNINKEGNHKDFIYELTSQLSLVSKEEAEVAIRILEVASYIGIEQDKKFNSLISDLTL